MSTREHILEIAYDLFIKNGFDNTTTRQIAILADVNLGLIPYYFDKKINLGIEAYTIMMKKLIERIDYNIISLSNPIERFYYGYLMIQYYISSNKNLERFYVECLQMMDLELEPQSQTVESLKQIIKTYEIEISEDRLEDIYIVFFGTQRGLTIKKQSGKLHMNYREMNATLVYIGLNLIGIDRQLVDDAIKSVDKKTLDIVI